VGQVKKRKKQKQSRQDKPTRFMREPTTARLMADLSIAAGVDALITWAPHHQPHPLQSLGQRALLPRVARTRF